MKLLGKSSKFIELIQAIEAAARCEVRVLMEGKSGTGKELVAKIIHQLSPRSSNKFVTIDCGAIPGNLIETKLFGHEKKIFFFNCLNCCTNTNKRGKYQCPSTGGNLGKLQQESGKSISNPE